MDNKKSNDRTHLPIDKAVSGDRDALSELLGEVQDTVFNLSLRMLGMVADAEDATQDILIRIMSNLASFRKDSAFTTWVYRLSVNYLIDYRKSMFAQRPLNFEFYGNDIRFAKTDDIERLVDDLTRQTLADELKMSCTNVMLQCLDAENRCIFILGTMFKLDSRIAGEILGMTPENYRQKLSRARKKMAGFLSEYCGLTGTGSCDCLKRVDHAVSQRRINPMKPDFLGLKVLEKDILTDCKEEMEKLDELSNTFETFPNYRSPITAQTAIDKLLRSPSLQKVQQY